MGRFWDGKGKRDEEREAGIEAGERGRGDANSVREGKEGRGREERTNAGDEGI